MKNNEYIELKKYKEMPFYYSFNDMANELIKAHHEGHLVKDTYDGEEYFSDITSWDEVYLKRYDMTKEEYDYYDTCTNDVIVEIMVSMSSQMCIDSERFYDYMICVYDLNSPEILQENHLIASLVSDLLIGKKTSYAMYRYRKLNEERKNEIEYIINNYFNEKYKEKIIKILRANNVDKKRTR